MSDPSKGTLQAGEILNNTYVIDALIGFGGTGEVYLAHNKVTDRALAIKILRKEFASDEAFINLMRREASVLHEVVDDAVVRYYDLLESDSHGGFVFLVMEFIKGVSMAEVVKKSGPMSAEDLLKIARRIAQGLRAAHDKKAFHRDLSPDNIILRDGSPDKAVLIDFGIARDVNENAQTVVGDGFAGKYQYAPPEQIDGKVDGRSDLYSLGMTLITGYRGKATGVGASLMEIIKTKTEEIDTSDISGLLGDLIAALVRPNPDDRFQSAQAMLDALDGSLSTEATVILPRAGASIPPRTIPPRGAVAPTAPPRPKTKVELPPEPVAKKSGGGRLVLIAVLVAVLGGAGWFFGMGPGREMIVGPSYPLVETWTFEAGDINGALLVSSNAQSPAASAALLAALGIGEQSAQIRLASGAPSDDWELRMAAIAQAARPLNAGWVLNITGTQGSLKGVANDDSVRVAVSSAAQTAASAAGVTLGLDVSVPSQAIELAVLQSALGRYETCGPLRVSGGDGVMLPPDAGVTVSGLIARPGDAEVVQTVLSDLADGRPVSLNLAVLNEPVCLIDNMLPVASSPLVNIEYLYGDRAGQAPDGVYHLGENPVIEATLPDAATGYLTAFYVDAEGQVFHLLPHMARTENTLSQIGTVAGGLRRVRLSWPVAEASTAQLGFNVIAPFGTNMVVAIVTQDPLFDRLRPRAESVAAFVEAFRGRAMVLNLTETLVSRRYLITEN